jgi:hypothetical protein
MLAFEQDKLVPLRIDTTHLPLGFGSIQGQRMKPRRSYFQENSDAGDRFASWKTKSWIVVRLISGSCEWDRNPSCVDPAARSMFCHKESPAL